MHQNAFIFVVPGVAFLTPWMQKSLKIVENNRLGHVNVLPTNLNWNEVANAFSSLLHRQARASE